MAELAEGYPPGHWRTGDQKDANHYCIDVDQDRHPAHPYDTPRCFYHIHHLEREADSFHAIDQDRLWSTPVPQGQAFYYIVSEEPLVLVPVPFGDRRLAPAEQIQALTLDQVQQDQARRRQMLEELGNLAGT